MATSAVGPTTDSEREWRVAEAIHNGQMESLNTSPATRAEPQEHITGRLGSAELVTRARARYGLT